MASSHIIFYFFSNQTSIDEAYAAVEDGNTKKVGELIDRKQKSLVRTTQMASFLHVAVINGHSGKNYLIFNTKNEKKVSFRERFRTSWK